jgi:hypothetical protein
VLYIGHFDFVEEDDRRHGYCTCVAEAENVDAAMEKFKSLIWSLKKNDDLFDGVQDVFLDSCIEASSIPEAGFLAHYTVYVGEIRGSISTSIRGVEPDQCSAYDWADDEEDGDEDNDEQIHGRIPFVSFDSKPSDA